MILLLTLLSVWPADWYQEYSQLNWADMAQVSSEYGNSASELAVRAISQFGSGEGDPFSLAAEAVAVDSNDYRSWTALAFVGMEQDSIRMDNLFSRAFELAPDIDPVLSETYAYWLLSIGNSAEAVIHANDALGADSSFGPAWLTLSMALMDEGNPENALSVSQEATQRLPECIPLLHQYAEILEETEDVDSAVAIYREVIRRDSGRISAYTALALLLEGTKQNGEAIKVYRELLKVSPEYGWAWSQLASCMLQEHRSVLADSFFQRSLLFSPDNSNSLYQLARLRTESDPVYAIELLERAVLISPDFLYGWQELAFLYESAGNFASAEMALRRCIEIDPEPWLYGELGWVLESRGLLAEAASVYETSVLIDSLYLYGWQRRGDLFRMDGENRAAAEWYREALNTLEEDDSWIWSELGSLAVAESLMDSAGYCFQMALESNGEASHVWLDLSRVQRITGRTEEALISLEEYGFAVADSSVTAAEKIILFELLGENTSSMEAEMLSAWPDAWVTAGWSALDGSFDTLALQFADRAMASRSNTPWHSISLGELYGSLEIPDKRRLCYERALAMDSDDFYVAMSIADYYYTENQVQESIDLLSATYHSYPFDQELTSALAEAYLFDDQLDSAEELLLEVMEENPVSVYAICYLGLIEENRGNLEGALNMYLQALRIEPGYPYAEDRLRYISSENYDPEYTRARNKALSWSAWVDLSSTGGNIDEQNYGGGASITFKYGQRGSSLSLEANTRTEISNGKDIRKGAWTSLSSEHFLTDHLYAGASTSWDRQPITVRPWQVSSYLAAGWKSWPASWIWIAPEIGAGLVNTRWSTGQERTNELTTYFSLSTWASGSVSWLPSLWLSGSVYVPGDRDNLVADAVGELEFDLPGRVSLILGSSLDYTRTPVVESWEKLDSEVYIRLRF